MLINEALLANITIKGPVINYGGGGRVAPKRKGLGKHNFEWVKGWVIEKQNNSRVV